jgi:hypothetical protein
MRRGTDNFWALMREQNARHGTAFGTTRSDANTVIGTNALYGVMAFDRKNRKIAYVTKAGKSVEILDYRFIRSWCLNYDQMTAASGASVGAFAFGSARTRRSNVAIEIATNDLNRPTLVLRVHSEAYGRQAIERLNILINS